MLIKQDEKSFRYHHGINAMQTEAVGDEIFKGPGKYEHELYGYKETNRYIIRFEVLTAVTNKIVDFWDVTPCSWGPLDQTTPHHNLEDHNLHADGGAVSLQVFIRQSRVQTV